MMDAPEECPRCTCPGCMGECMVIRAPIPKGMTPEARHLYQPTRCRHDIPMKEDCEECWLDYHERRES